MRLNSFVVLLSMIPKLLLAQDTLAWGEDMNERMDELTRREMKWDPMVTIPSDSGDIARPLRTIEAAILLLGIPDLTTLTEVTIFDFLDSAACEMWKDGSPTLLHGCHHILHPEALASEEREFGYRYVCVLVGYPNYKRSTDGIAVFNHRTRRLLGLPDK